VETIGGEVVEMSSLPISIDCTQISLMANGYLELSLFNSLVPYIGLGTGKNWTQEKIILHYVLFPEEAVFLKGKFYDNYWINQAIVGLSFPVYYKLKGAVEYRYVATSNFFSHTHIVNLKLKRFF
jgi:hypothetical protein